VRWGSLTRRSTSIFIERYIGDESARARFLREARAAARLRHSNVASVSHLGKSAGNYFYAMEFVEGETLDRLIKRSGRLDVKLALEIATQVAAGLAAVHEQNLVHRDIKPSNIMVRLKEEGVTAKIIDLDLPKTLDESVSEAGDFIAWGRLIALTPGIDPDGYHHYHNPMVRCRTSCTTASPPDSA